MADKEMADKEIDEDREIWLGVQVDHYVRALRDRPDEAESFLKSQTDKELVELCEGYTAAIKSAVENGYVPRKRVPRKRVPAKAPIQEIILVFGLLVCAFIMLYAGIEMAELKRQNRNLKGENRNLKERLVELVESQK